MYCSVVSWPCDLLSQVVGRCSLPALQSCWPPHGQGRQRRQQVTLTVTARFARSPNWGPVLDLNHCSSGDDGRWWDLMDFDGFWWILVDFDGFLMDFGLLLDSPHLESIKRLSEAPRLFGAVHHVELDFRLKFWPGQGRKRKEADISGNHGWFWACFQQITSISNPFHTKHVRQHWRVQLDGLTNRALVRHNLEVKTAKDVRHDSTWFDRFPKQKTRIF